MTKAFTHYAPRDQKDLHLVDRPDTCICLPRCTLVSIDALPGGRKVENWKVEHKHKTPAELKSGNSYHGKGFAE